MKSRKRISKINSSVFIIVGTEQSDKSATLKRKQMSWAGGDLVHKMTAVGGLILELYTHIKARPSGWQDLIIRAVGRGQQDPWGVLIRQLW